MMRLCNKLCHERVLTFQPLYTTHCAFIQNRQKKERKKEQVTKNRDSIDSADTCAAPRRPAPKPPEAGTGCYWHHGELRLRTLPLRGRYKAFANGVTLLQSFHKRSNAENMLK